MRGSELIDELKAEFGASTSRELATCLGGSPANMDNLNRLETVSAKRTSRLVKRARDAVADDWLSVITEFHPIEKTRSTGQKKWEILDAKSRDNQQLVDTLKDNIGIYLFYDSTGGVIYVGKTKAKSGLWYEMKSAFNRRNVDNPIYRVRPSRRKNVLMSNDGQHPPITRDIVPIHETAAYFTAYQVDLLFIDQIETLFIRAIPNNLTNVRIEGQSKPAKKAAIRVKS